MTTRICLTPDTRLVLDALHDAKDKQAPIWGWLVCKLTGLPPETALVILGRLVDAGWATAEDETEPPPDRGARCYYAITPLGTARYMMGVAKYAARHPEYEFQPRTWPATAY
jgi:hypothetical protein